MKFLPVFIKEFFCNAQETGSLLPSSKYLSLELIRYFLEHEKTDLKILEIGPGTGAITNQIVKYLKHGQTLHLCEINKRFVQILKYNFRKNIYYEKNKQRIKIFNKSILDLNPEKKYDIIISCIPLNNFDIEFIEEFFKHLKKLKKENTIFSFFEYFLFNKYKFLFYLKEKKYITKRRRELIDNILNKYEFDNKMVVLNVPVAIVHHLKI